MFLKYFEIKNIRSILSYENEFSKGINLIYGKNGVGKTTILEAIHVLSISKSFRSGYRKNIQKTTEIHTVGVGKVMSAGVPLLACGTKGKRRIAKNCRIMIHSVSAGNQGNLHDLMNELGAVEELQKMYINCLVEETKMTKSQLKKMLKRKVNVYLSAEQAIKLGIADEIL